MNASGYFKSGGLKGPLSLKGMFKLMEEYANLKSEELVNPDTKIARFTKMYAQTSHSKDELVEVLSVAKLLGVGVEYHTIHSGANVITQIFDVPKKGEVMYKGDGTYEINIDWPKLVAEPFLGHVGLTAEEFGKAIAEDTKIKEAIKPRNRHVGNYEEAQSLEARLMPISEEVFHNKEMCDAIRDLSVESPITLEEATKLLKGSNDIARDALVIKKLAFVGFETIRINQVIKALNS